MEEYLEVIQNSEVWQIESVKQLEEQMHLNQPELYQWKINQIINNNKSVYFDKKRVFDLVTVKFPKNSNNG